MTAPATEVKTKFITLRPVGTNTWFVVNNRSQDVIGYVEWYAAWRQYVFSAVEAAVWNHECLTVIADFLQQQSAARKANR